MHYSPCRRTGPMIHRVLSVANEGKMLAKDIKKNHFAEFQRVCDFAETKPYRHDLTGPIFMHWISQGR
jgi:hypothetical protein